MMIIVLFIALVEKKSGFKAFKTHVIYIFVSNEFRRTRNSLVSIILMTIMAKKSEMNVQLFSKKLVHT